jgi:hypothetical protein
VLRCDPMLRSTVIALAGMLASASVAMAAAGPAPLRWMAAAEPVDASDGGEAAPAADASPEAGAAANPAVRPSTVPPLLAPPAPVPVVPPAPDTLPRQSPPPTAGAPAPADKTDKADAPPGGAEEPAEDAAHMVSLGDAFHGGAGDGVSFRLLLQARYAQDFPIAQQRPNADERERDLSNATENDGFRMNRVFLRAIARPRKWIQARLLVDFAELRWGNRNNVLKLAYVNVRPWSRVHVTAGFFKRPYSLLELLPIAEFEFADVGPTDEVIKELGFAGRDTGAMVQVDPLPKKSWLNLSLGTFAGDTEGRYASPVGVVVGRAESRPVPSLRLGVDAAWRPRRTKALYGSDDVPVDYLDRGTAFSVDVTWAVQRLELRAEGLYGKRVDMTSRLADGLYRGDCPSGLCHWVASWGLATYRIPVGKKLVVMPAVRAEWLEMNREQHQGQRTYLTGALNVDITPELRLLMDVSWRHVQRQSQTLNGLNNFTALPVYDLNGTRMTVQAQIKI